MPETIPDLWPADLGSNGPLPPVVILRLQASRLAERTRGLLEAEVRSTSGSAGQFNYTFELVAPALDDYRFPLFSIHHDINLYPVVVRAEAIRAEPYKADSPEAFSAILREVLSHETTLRALRSLLAQSTA
jgi:hypothetical protein